MPSYQSPLISSYKVLDFVLQNQYVNLGVCGQLSFIEGIGCGRFDENAVFVLDCEIESPDLLEGLTIRALNQGEAVTIDCELQSDPGDELVLYRCSTTDSVEQILDDDCLISLIDPQGNVLTTCPSDFCAPGGGS